MLPINWYCETTIGVGYEDLQEASLMSSLDEAITVSESLTQTSSRQDRIPLSSISNLTSLELTSENSSSYNYRGQRLLFRRHGVDRFPMYASLRSTFRGDSGRPGLENVERRDSISTSSLFEQQRTSSRQTERPIHGIRLSTRRITALLRNINLSRLHPEPRFEQLSEQHAHEVAENWRDSSGEPSSNDNPLSREADEIVVESPNDLNERFDFTMAALFSDNSSIASIARSVSRVIPIRRDSFRNLRSFRIGSMLRRSASLSGPPPILDPEVFDFLGEGFQEGRGSPGPLTTTSSSERAALYSETRVATTASPRQFSKQTSELISGSSGPKSSPVSRSPLVRGSQVESNLSPPSNSISHLSPVSNLIDDMMMTQDLSWLSSYLE